MWNVKTQNSFVFFFFSYFVVIFPEFHGSMNYFKICYAENLVKRIDIKVILQRENVSNNTITDGWLFYAFLFHCLLLQKRHEKTVHFSNEKLYFWKYLVWLLSINSFYFNIQNTLHWIKFNWNIFRAEALKAMSKFLCYTSYTYMY